MTRVKYVHIIKHVSKALLGPEMIINFIPNLKYPQYYTISFTIQNIIYNRPKYNQWRI